MKPATARRPLVTPDSARIVSATCCGRSSDGRPSAAPPRTTPLRRRELGDLAVGDPGRALDRRAELLGQRAERRPLLGDRAVVALDDGQHRHRAPGHRLALARAPVAHLAARLADLARRVVLHRAGDDVAAHAEVLGAPARENARAIAPNASQSVARLPRRRDRLVERVHERVHVGHRQVELLVPGRGRQDDVRVQAGRGHAEVDVDQQVELAARDLVAPAHLGRALALGQRLGQRAVVRSRRAGGA